MITSGDNYKAMALPGTIQGSFPVWGTWQLSGTVQVHSFSVYDPLLFPRTIQGTSLSISCLWPLTFSNDPRHVTFHFLFMTPYFFHERSKARHSPFPVYDPWLVPRTGQGDGIFISCKWSLTTSWDDIQWTVQKRGGSSGPNDKPDSIGQPYLFISYTSQGFQNNNSDWMRWITRARAYPATQVLSFPNCGHHYQDIADRFCNKIRKTLHVV